MCEKIKNLMDKYWRNIFKIIIVSWAILIVVNIIAITFQNKWSDLIYYPEKEYKVLEEEAERIVKEHDFETEYKYKITGYDSENKYMSFELMSSEVSINVMVSNYNSDNQTVDIIRFRESAKQHILLEVILVVLLMPLLFTVLINLILICVSIMIYIIIFIIDVIKTSISEVREKENTAKKGEL